MGPTVARKRPIEADAAAGVEVGGVGERQRRLDPHRGEQVMSEAHVVDEGAEIRLEGAGLGGFRIAVDAECLADRRRAPPTRLGDQLGGHVAP